MSTVMGRGGGARKATVSPSARAEPDYFDLQIEGVPLRSLREAFKAIKPNLGYRAEAYAERLRISLPHAKRLMSALHKQGYLEPMPSRPEYFEQTELAMRLAQKRLRRTSRAAAERQLATFLDRVRSLEQQTPFIYEVERVLLFGSLARPDASDVGDIDLLVELRPMFEKSEAESVRGAYLARQREKGRSFNHILAEFMAPEEDVLKYLKKGLTLVSLHGKEDLGLAERGAHRVVYQRSPQRRAA